MRAIWRLGYGRSNRSERAAEPRYPGHQIGAAQRRRHGLLLVQVNLNGGNHMILFDTVNRGTKEAPANPAADSFLREPGIHRGMDAPAAIQSATNQAQRAALK